jgi:hypothetical protein
VALPDQTRSDPLPLAFGQDGNRCQGQAGQSACLRDDGEVAEEDVADDPATRDKRAYRQSRRASSCPKACRLTQCRANALLLRVMRV